MFKFIRAKGGPHHSAERQKLQKELFAFRKTLQHGFPNKPTAIAWDPELRLLCIGTGTGSIKVFGQPGVEFYGQHSSIENPITKIVFLPGTGKVISLCDDNSLHLWEINQSSLVEVKSQALEGKLKKISAMCVESSGKNLLLGTEGGNIYLLDVQSFEISSDIIYQDVVMQNVPEDYKLNPGAVEIISEQPEKPNNILIGYNRGLMVLWNRSENTAVQTFISSQQLEYFCWHENGLDFTSSHNDGSYATWNVENGEKPSLEPVTTYGPFPCKAITKIMRKTMEDEPLIVFSGGMPRASYSDKFTVSVIHGEKHVAFDFTSKIIDFFVVNKKPETSDDEDHENSETLSENSSDEPEALIVLAEEELVAIDLLSEDWRMMNLPYLVSLHASAVTCSQHVSSVPDEVWENIKNAGKAQIANMYSQRDWPINGGSLLCSKGAEEKRELLLTGHEDGTVRFWDASGVALTPLYKYSTSSLYTGEDIIDDHSPAAEDEEEEWPPFRKTGVFDPYSDDPRLAVKKVILCPLSGTLVVAGTAGHVVIAKFNNSANDIELKNTIMNIVSDRDNFVWKGHDQLSVRQGTITQAAGFQASALLQLHPPAAITCCVLHAEWGLVAAGTAHGLALFDYMRNKPVVVKCTLNPNDLSGAGDTPISRRKSFKKSLRESFRRLRKGRSQRRAGSPTPAAAATTSPSTKKPVAGESEGPFSPLEPKPIERQIEARPVDDTLGSMVRCLYFARSFLVSVQNTIPTLWAGTNNGTVYVFTITVPSGQRRQDDDIICQLGKEIQLKHRAPVIGIAVLDGSSKPLPEPLEVEQGVAPLPDATQPHRVIIASEEQFKVFTLPSLKPFCKYKLTAHEGARVRRMSFATFHGSPNAEHPYSEVCLLCLTNLGDCLILSIPELKRQLNAAAIRREDINGISSLTFTKDGEALYLHSSSELQRITLAVQKQTCARCYLSLPTGTKAESDTGETIESPEDKTEDTTAPMVNGNADSKESSVMDKIDEVRENGEDTPHDVTVSSSIGDITIDSVKDHLTAANDAANEINYRLSGIQLNSTSQSNVIVKTTTTTITQGNAGEVTSSTITTTTRQNENN